ncbi:hypothetical protein [Chryseobacterium turcicum]|uniref:Uncharacterized protein n=1 Tax=Chryseobacterium turcicum TaxID=2898076 RepID=A0A9Q3YXR0_9FLAO|nr:hypothetical protein [Chryseobacterium turcicum]MCD1117417.1 hypothetical protein [Chryseobacterium turcicum]
MSTAHQKILEEKFTAYIIKYISPNFVDGIYLIWFTDNDSESTDKLLTLKNGRIFSSKKIENIKDEIINLKHEIDNYERFIIWLNDDSNLESIEDNFYDTKFLLNQIEQNNFPIDSIELFANYINLFGDYARQNEKNNYLLEFENNSTIKQLWNYYYEAIFWPRFYNKVDFESTQLPFLDINKSELHIRLSEIITELDNKIHS